MALPWPPWQQFGRNKFLYAVFICQRNVTIVETFAVEQNLMSKASLRFLTFDKRACMTVITRTARMFVDVSLKDFSHPCSMGKGIAEHILPCHALLKPRLRWQNAGQRHQCKCGDAMIYLCYIAVRVKWKPTQESSTVGTANLLLRRLRLKWTLQKGHVSTSSKHELPRCSPQARGNQWLTWLFWDSL